ncbi:CbiX/SirB N-terminal domain-containing protein [Lipingzhangella sp. LS1_29]|uniref:CbiX/SirB N-terminal domain-containing protein n=1 Tax=Lipingzhangella rawalii TaxID=2055835 RepID=A0ABU2H7P4_9ACTN|nr:CbiX/SirB N-terminal domain-containing protein [Lipingzhangella rawalii]MDS1270864.1 CbiX/SirB N-terminal domain-containing protein [Lipingzhangella rawalii]
MTAPLVLAVHGTRQQRGQQAAHDLARRVQQAGTVPVRLAFADVCAPSVGDVAARLHETASGAGRDATSAPESGVVVVPAFLAAGYHVRVDIPAQLAEAVPDPAWATVTEPIGADERLLDALEQRVRRAQWQPGDGVVLAAAGTSDPRAQREVQGAADRLADRLGVRVVVGYVATSGPTVPEVTERLRAAGHPRVIVAAWLLAPGLFHDRLAHSGADVVTDPLCTDDGVVSAVLARYRDHARRLRMSLPAGA